MSDRFIGIDVGGTKIAVAALQAGELSESTLHHTELGSQEALVDQLVHVIETARTPDTMAVGIGLPSLVEFATGRIRSSVNVPLKDLPLRELLSERAGLPVYVENDASCAALAEAFRDGHMAVPHLVMFTVGTGVGGGLVLNGRLFRGATGAAAEVGHTIVGLDLVAGAPEHSGVFPQDGSLERLASGTALDRLAEEAAKADPNSFLGRRLTRSGRGHRPRRGRRRTRRRRGLDRLPADPRRAAGDRDRQRDHDVRPARGRDRRRRVGGRRVPARPGARDRLEVRRARRRERCATSGSRTTARGPACSEPP